MLAAVALLWPSRFIGPLDGMPLDAPADALLAGLVLPALLWFDPRYLRQRAAQAIVVTLLVWKAAGAVLMTQQGLCLRASTLPFGTDVQSIRIVEPLGVLRSWDVRADLQSEDPGCTAIVTRPLTTLEAFPAWFLNVHDYPNAKRDVRMRLSGFITTDRPQMLSVDVGPDMTAARRIDTEDFQEQPVALAAGTHVLEASMTATGNGWRLEPALDGRPLWSHAAVFTRAPTWIDHAFAPWAWLVAPSLVLLLIGGWVWRLVAVWRPGTRMIAAVLLMSAVSAVLAVQTPSSFIQRTAGVLGFAALAVPVPLKLRNIRGAFLLVGVPWLTFFAAYTFRDIGHFTAYSADDWLSYQVAGYRIVMHGYWLEGGTLAFDYQPLYRWITGLLHLVFGDSSVGEFYWDAAWLLCGALLAFWLVRARAGFRWGLAAAAATLAMFMLGTTWYVAGRGLSEITAAGWGFLAMFFLLRSRLGRLSAAATAGGLSVLMFYTRLNHLLLPIFLPALLLPLRVSSVWTDVWQGVKRIRPALVAVYASVFSMGVLLLMTRTWLYTGVFSLFHGTSLKHNDTGLRPWTLFEGEVWRKVGHSLAGLVFLNEPPRPDPRTMLVTLGALAAVLAIAQVPAIRRLRAAVTISCLGAGVGALFAHTHAYPGRMSIHLVPLATALTITVVALVVGRAWRVSL